MAVGPPHTIWGSLQRMSLDVSDLYLLTPMFRTPNRRSDQVNDAGRRL